MPNIIESNDDHRDINHSDNSGTLPPEIDLSVVVDDDIANDD